MAHRPVLQGAFLVAVTSLLVIAATVTYVSSPRHEVLAQASIMELVPLKSAAAGMPQVYVMEPVPSNAQKLSQPSATTDLAQLDQPKPKAAVRPDLPVSVAFPLSNKAAARPQARKPVARPVVRSKQPLATAQEKRFEEAYPAETEAQALQRAKYLAREDYLKSYQTAVQAENSAEARERKNRIIRAQHEAQRADMFKTLKGRADKKEGWVKLEREMGMIMDGVDGLHYKGYSGGR